MKNYAKFTMTIIALALIPGFWGCTENNQQLGAAPLRDSSGRHKVMMQNNRMVHNAEMVDMTISDLHFLPNRPDLNSNGTQRLSHLAWIIKKYGGKVILDVREPKSMLTKMRMRTIRKYMIACGVPKKEVKVEIGLSEYKGMDAEEAMEIYKDTRFKPGKGKKSALKLP